MTTATMTPKKAIAEKRPQLEAYEKLCDEIGITPGQCALAWLLANPAVTAPIIGPRTLEQLEDAGAAVDIILSTETLEYLNKLFPGPGGEAPMAYAW